MWLATCYEGLLGIVEKSYLVNTLYCSFLVLISSNYSSMPVVVEQCDSFYFFDRRGIFYGQLCPLAGGANVSVVKENACGNLVLLLTEKKRTAKEFRW